MTPETLIFVVSAVLSGGVWGMIIKSWADKRKTAGEASLLQAQAKDVLVQAGERTVEMLGKELDRALARIAHLEDEVEELKAENARLREQVIGRPGGRRVTDPPESMHD